GIAPSVAVLTSFTLPSSGLPNLTSLPTVIGEQSYLEMNQPAIVQDRSIEKATSGNLLAETPPLPMTPLRQSAFSAQIADAPHLWAVTDEALSLFAESLQPV